jgi:hypothetical protein
MVVFFNSWFCLVLGIHAASTFDGNIKRQKQTQAKMQGSPVVDVLSVQVQRHWRMELPLRFSGQLHTRKE